MGYDTYHRSGVSGSARMFDEGILMLHFRRTTLHDETKRPEANWLTPIFVQEEGIGIDEWVIAALEYINLLGDACAHSAVFLYVHGIEETEENIQRGKELREILGIKGSGE